MYESEGRAIAGDLERLVSVPHVSTSDRDLIPPVSGVYLFSEGAAHLYVGVATGNHLRARIRQHFPVHPDIPREHTAATLAEKLAIEEARVAGRVAKKVLYRNPEFRRAFWRLRQRIAAMDLRFVEVADWNRGKAVEGLAAWVLRPRYNSPYWKRPE